MSTRETGKVKDKNYSEVLIDGKIYTLGGAEEELYLQKVAAYINDKLSQLKKQPGFTKQSTEYRAVMLELNLADDYFKVKGRMEELQMLHAEVEKENYSLKHELISTQMKLEEALRQSERKNN